jgi:hypothetical protein
MQVTAFSTPKRPDWRWRIVNYAGETLHESRDTFPTIAAAVARGQQYMSRLRADRSSPVRAWRSTSHLRSSSSR